MQHSTLYKKFDKPEIEHNYFSGNSGEVYTDNHVYISTLTDKIDNETEDLKNRFSRFEQKFIDREKRSYYSNAAPKPGESGRIKNQRQTLA